MLDLLFCTTHILSDIGFSSLVIFQSLVVMSGKWGITQES
jgi:hypothetical protein